MLKHSRHQCSCKSLEEKGNGGSCTREVRSESRTHGEQSSEESNGGEEQGDQVEGEHESRQQVELVGSNEALGQTIGGTEVARRIKWQSRYCLATVAVQSIHHAADLEECPSCRIASRCSSSGVCLEEVRLIEWRNIDHSRKDDKEGEEYARAEDN